MPSARRQSRPSRLAVAVCTGALLLGGASGCETTQEKAAEHRAEAERILEARAERQKKHEQKETSGNEDEPRKNGGKKQ